MTVNHLQWLDVWFKTAVIPRLFGAYNDEIIIGLVWENLQETKVFTIKYGGFRGFRGFRGFL